MANNKQTIKQLRAAIKELDAARAATNDDQEVNRILKAQADMAAEILRIKGFNNAAGAFDWATSKLKTSTRKLNNLVKVRKNAINNLNQANSVLSSFLSVVKKATA